MFNVISYREPQTVTLSFLALRISGQLPTSNKIFCPFEVNSRFYTGRYNTIVHRRDSQQVPLELKKTPAEYPWTHNNIAKAIVILCSDKWGIQLHSYKRKIIKYWNINPDLKCTFRIYYVDLLVNEKKGLLLLYLYRKVRTWM